MNFLFPNARVVFIHIPKTAGTAIRIALGKPFVGPIAGHMPASWQAYTSFAVVRHPVTRLLSAVNMFRSGADNVSEKDYYREPRWPDLTVDRALDILEDSSFKHDRSIRADEHNLKHHIWHQTDPYNCLQYAEKILRYETLQGDFELMCEELGLQISLPLARHTAGQPGALRAEDLAPDQIERLAQVYAQDFDLLAYDSDSITESTNLPRTVPAANQIISAQEDPVLQNLWPQYCNNRDAQTYTHPLPEPDIDLSLLVKESVPGRPRPTWPGREPDPIQHFHHLEPEFAGRPFIAHLLACTIVMVRRDPNDERSKTLFSRIINEHSKDVAPRINSRWLTSVCDTLVDISDNDIDRLIGMSGSLFANTIKFTETERNLFYPERPWPPKARLGKVQFLYDGVIPFSTRSGDAMSNVIERVERVLSMEQPSAVFVRELVTRAIEGDTVFRRFAQLTGRDVPFAEAPDIRRLKLEMKKL